MTPTEQPPIPDARLIALEDSFKDTVNQFAAYTHAINQSKGFCLKPLNIEQQIAQLMLVVSELSEATEGLRKDLMDDKLTHRKMVEVELADAFIRILNIGAHCGYDVAGAAVEKSRFNAMRPWKNGGKAL